jgi:hypothetical protein
LALGAHMSIEFGILRDGSTITLMGEHRVDLDEDVLPELEPLFRSIELRTGQTLDTYGSAAFSGQALDAMIEELQRAHDFGSGTPKRVHAFLSELLRVAHFAKTSGKPLSYFGL